MVSSIGSSVVNTVSTNISFLNRMNTIITLASSNVGVTFPTTLTPNNIEDIAEGVGIVNPIPDSCGNYFAFTVISDVGNTGIQDVLACYNYLNEMQQNYNTDNMNIAYNNVTQPLTGNLMDIPTKFCNDQFFFAMALVLVPLMAGGLIGISINEPEVTGMWLGFSDRANTIIGITGTIGTYFVPYFTELTYTDSSGDTVPYNPPKYFTHIGINVLPPTTNTITYSQMVQYVLPYLKYMPVGSGAISLTPAGSILEAWITPTLDSTLVVINTSTLNFFTNLLNSNTVSKIMKAAINSCVLSQGTLATAIKNIQQLNASEFNANVVAIGGGLKLETYILFQDANTLINVFSYQPAQQANAAPSYPSSYNNGCNFYSIKSYNSIATMLPPLGAQTYGANGPQNHIAALLPVGPQTF